MRTFTVPVKNRILLNSSLVVRTGVRRLGIVWHRGIFACTALECFITYIHSVGNPLHFFFLLFSGGTDSYPQDRIRVVNQFSIKPH